MKTKTLIIFLLTVNICLGQKLNKCSNYLVDNFYNSPYDKQFIQEIISPKDSNIVLTDLFQIVQNGTKDRFLAFFLTNRISKTKLDLTEDKLSYNLSGSIPKYNGFTLSIIKYNDKWFFIKDNIMSFSENSIDSAKKFYFCEILLRLNFINCLNKKPNKDFWNNNEFSEVKIQKNWNQSDLEINKPYLGLPKIVASSLKNKFNTDKKRLDEKIYADYIIPQIEKLKQNQDFEDVSSIQMKKEFVLLYPPDRNTILYPINLKRHNDSLYTLKFFALQKKGDDYELYEWIYLKPVKYEKRVYVSPLHETINSLTYWTYTMPYISNTDFWTKCVTTTQNDNFIYLKKTD